MSDPMSAVEIEDVLSSIRRLVSEDLRPVSRPTIVSNDGAEKLILTPALRVVTSDPVAVAVDAIELAAPDARGALMADDMLDDPAPDLRSLLDQMAHAPKDQPVSQVEHPVEHAPAVSAVDALLAVMGEAEPLSEWEPEAEATLPPTGWSSDNWAATPEDVADDLIDDDETERDESEVIATVVADASADAWGGDEPWPDDGAAEVIFHSSRRETATMDAQHADWAEAAAVAELGDLEEVSRYQPSADDAAPDPTLIGARVGVFDQEDTLLDEEVLRELVRDIIREELQGGLGERITRNVRKLVRAEIYRAIASRDFE